MTDGSIVHMVVMKKKTQVASKTEEPVRTTSSEPANSSLPYPPPSKPSTERVTPTISIPTSARMSNPLPTPPGPQLRSFPRSVPPSDPLSPDGMPAIDKSTGDMLKQMMKSNPDLFMMMIKADPGMKNILEKNPQIEAMLHDPAIVDEMIEMMTDPEAMKDMQRQADHALGEISDHPEAAVMYDRLVNQYYESVDKINDRHGVSHQEEVTEEEARNPNLPNLWGSSSSSSSAAAARSARSARSATSNPWPVPPSSGFNIPESVSRHGVGATQTPGENTRESSSFPLGGGSFGQGQHELMYRMMEENPELLAAVGLCELV